MAKWKPPLEDVPMSLGDHLHELRRRLILPICSIAILFLLAFAFEHQLKLLVLKPLDWAYDLYPEKAAALGMTKPIKLLVLDVFESPMASMTVSFYTALFFAFPILVYQLWMFVSVGLLPKERRLAFLFIPAGIMFFYAGTFIGYFIGLPNYYGWMIKWAANDPTALAGFTMEKYHANFKLMTMMFGLIADIPWLIMVLVRVGFVTIEQLEKNRKAAIMVNTVIAGLITPPDPWSMLIMMVPLFALFELGLLLARIMVWRNKRFEASEKKAAEDKAAADEQAARAMTLATPVAAATAAATTAVTPETHSNTASPVDGPISRDQLSILPPLENNSTEQGSVAAETADNNSSSLTDNNETTASAAPETPVSIPEPLPPPPPPLPRGMDEAGLFAEEENKLGDQGFYRD
jgi:sec-independent protein translocase protein TatC